MAADYQDIILAREDRIATITLNRPEKVNALSPAMMDGVVRAVDEVRQDDEIRVLVINGAGRGFCSGADVSGIGERAQWTSAESVRWMERLPFVRLASLMRSLKKPTIASVHGVALGGGFSLALACDIRIAAQSAQFGMLYARLGLVPDMGATFILPQVVGVSRACEIMFSADTIDSAEAERIGLVSRVVPDAELEAATRELASKLAKRAPISLGHIKHAIYRGLRSDLDSHMDLEIYLMSLCRETEDHKEALRAFLEKREPLFRGR